MPFPRAMLFVVVLIGLLLGSPGVRAQCSGPNCHVLSGDVSDTLTGPLLSGHVYVANGIINVPMGQTLTVQPGAIVKSNYVWFVRGKLLANGTPTQPIVFTSQQDDLAGGDTNGDGAATVPGKGNWSGMEIISDPGSQITHVDFRYAGANFHPFLLIYSTGHLVQDVTFAQCYGDAVNFFTNGAATVADCHIEACRYPFSGLRPSLIAGFSGNTAAAMTSGVSMSIGTVSALGSSATWGPTNMVNGTGALLAEVDISVNTGVVLTLQPGLVLKFAPFRGMTVNGTLITNGTPASPVVFTSREDDDYGGDTGSGTPQPGDWKQILLTATAGASEMHGAIVRYAGDGIGALRLASDAWIDGTTVEASQNTGINVDFGVQPTITGCAFLDNGTTAISQVVLSALAGMSGNTASGNGSGDAVVIGGGTLTTSATLSPSSAFNGSGAFVLGSTTYVGTGVTLTLAAGVTIKGSPATVPTLQVSGNLVCNGLPGQEVVFTSLYDDTYGGDVNADGNATTPSPGNWSGLSLIGYGTGTLLKHTRIRHAGGSGGSASVRIANGDPTLENCTIERGSGPALDANGMSPTLIGCAFDLCAGDAPIVDLELGALASLSSCTATGNAVSDSLRFTESTLDAAIQISKANTLNGDGVLLMAGNLVVPVGTGLTLDAGMTVKFDGTYRLDVRAPLLCNGTSSEPVVFTDVTDDWAGDSDGSGGPPSDGTPGSWQQIVMIDAPASVLTYTRIANAGNGSVPSLNPKNGTVVALDHVTIERGLGTGLQLDTYLASSVTNCRFDSCLRPVDGARVALLAGFSGNTAAGNVKGDAMRVTQMGTQPPGGFVLGKTSSLNGDGVYVIASTLFINAGESWEIGPGVVMKFSQPSSQMAINGTLTVNGSQVEPVVFTSIHDDDFGGADDDATAPQPGDWKGFAFQGSSDASMIDHAIIRYAGYQGAASVDLVGADITLCNVVIEWGAGDGIDTHLNSAPVLKNVDIENNVDAAIAGITWNVLGQMTGVSATGNGGDLDATVISSPVVVGDVLIEKDNVFGSCIVVMVTPQTNSLHTLSFGRGVIVKAGLANVAMPVKDVRGIGLDKTVFTSIFDDAWGGDTNGDGNASSPQPADWLGVTSYFGDVEHALIRYAGGIVGGLPAAGLEGFGSAKSVRAEFCAGVGVETKECENVVAFANLGDGILADVARNCTASRNGGIGLRVKRSSFCVAWHNGPTLAENYLETTGPLVGCPPCQADIIWSIGSDLSVSPPVQGAPGFFGCPSVGWGNLRVDPLFVDELGGDLRLSANSPARNYFLTPCPPAILADIGICKPWGLEGQGYPGPPASSRDYDENSRRSDALLQGATHKVADLGAHERVAWTLSVDADPELGEVFSLRVNGPAGAAYFLLGLPIDAADDAFLSNWGWLMVDADVFFTVAVLPVGASLPIAMPLDTALHGLEISFQAGVTLAGNPSIRELTNVFPARLHL